ncbi:MAG: bifunctional diaminohydroxyphosphoribosylaminopyrimidine deaminase/5-amino-6-(5-phosphoribosylamino)uracil reductase RibD [Proteobacteria bacterium]|nr:bifunctional diaminohydroxyphosphoribosylaminopyrimidine deaminase/5-amino-6-(5-phosphoribosylamino)uracil reductase RibD [Pseudomonadota bacterium]
MSKEQAMELALALALEGAGRTSPNPMVGAVVVSRGRVIGRGFHRRAGAAHAEVNALRDAGARARGADLYVTLEPCCHHGRTPPCTDAIVRAGVARVFVGAIDPNPAVRGRGVAALRRAGVEVKVGLLRDECRAINAAYNRLMESGVPFVTAKAAVTLDGRIAAADGSSRWITNAEARTFGHTLRARHDAVMVGIGTALADDPSLTARLPGARALPRRAVVADSRLRIPNGLTLMKRAAGSLIVLTTDRAPRARADELRAMGHQVVETKTKGGRVDMREALAALGRMGIASVLVEGGGSLISEMVGQGLVDRMAIFVAPKFLGTRGAELMPGLLLRNMGEAIELEDVEIKALGDNVLIDGMLRRRCSQG